MLPSGVGDAVTSFSPTSANASTTQRAAFSHSSGGYCLGSATDLKAISSARSSLARPISAPTARRRSSVATSVLDHVVELQVVELVPVLVQLVRAVRLEDQRLAANEIAVDDHRPATDEVGAIR